MIFCHLHKKSDRLRVRGLKHTYCLHYVYMFHVAPRTGAWIETMHRCLFATLVFVAPRTGAWIETDIRKAVKPLGIVAPRTGAWIEASLQISHVWNDF